MFKKTSIKRHRKDGQSTVEYIILVAAVLAALIIFLKPGGIFSKAYNTTLSSSTNGMTVMASRLGSSRPPSP